MVRPGPANDEERLPWLEPYRETKAAAVAPAKRSRGGLVVVAAALAVLVAAGGGYIVGQRAPQPTAPSPESVLNPVTPAPVALPAAEPPKPVMAEPVAPPKVATAKPVLIAHLTQRRVTSYLARPRRIRSAGIESARIRAVRAAQEHHTPPLPTPRVAYRPWPKMPSPGPAGQVIQLGAFTNPARANAVLRMRLARYPLLGRMPRVVVPVITKPRGQILYVLRLGTTSRQQSAIICRNLRASGDHCLVIG